MLMFRDLFFAGHVAVIALAGMAAGCAAGTTEVAYSDAVVADVTKYHPKVSQASSEKVSALAYISSDECERNGWKLCPPAGSAFAERVSPDPRQQPLDPGQHKVSSALMEAAEADCLPYAFPSGYECCVCGALP
jgi:hypothetical protein